MRLNKLLFPLLKELRLDHFISPGISIRLWLILVNMNMIFISRVSPFIYISSNNRRKIVVVSWMLSLFNEIVNKSGENMGLSRIKKILLLERMSFNRIEVRMSMVYLRQ